MPAVDVMDESWIGAAPRVVGAALDEPSRWPGWWPDLELRATERRGAKGMRWAVPAAAGGRLSGSMEIWLEAVAEGTVAHYFLRLDATGAALTAEQGERWVRHFRVQNKQVMWALADLLDPARLARLRAPRG